MNIVCNAVRKNRKQEGKTKVQELNIKWWNPKKEKLMVKRSGEVVYLAFPRLEACQEVVHGFSTRLGGISGGACSSMNLSFSRGDDPAAVAENYRRISRAIGFSPEDIVCSDQTHTTNVVVAEKKHCGSGVTREKSWTDVDGMVTNERGVVLCTSFADCVPLYFVDPVHHAIGLSHSGWRGTVGQIGKLTVEKMRQTYGTDPKDILAAIGPSICQDCYEVSGDVIIQIKEAYAEERWDSLFYAQGRPDGEEKYQLNLWQACRYTMLDAGILPQHISMPNLCTCCNPQFLFSHRASKGKRGNLNAFLMLK